MTETPDIVDCVIEDPRWEDAALPEHAARAALAVCDRLGLDPAAFEICVMGCDDARIATLNTEFRGKPTPTNVLSWPAEELAPEDEGATPELPQVDPEEALFGPAELGDIAISWDTCAREATAGGLSFSDHVTHLLVHGILHLLGYDHVRDGDAELMEGLETEILGKMGIADPY
ncbi:probable rRNA maturation factor [Pseudooceanicola antarcticus]|uniref:Endoribonuclease YbeY n=1 Tax=Pseudooceanicola antarcticus TaxID=1247613 RepID=A0A285IFG9_9RHOB|nr:rRNA maturation RNase YbeY [Pseudooceanicola antarcticus]PJE29243.1 rRNA maturation RNase YbeY [Pseudooceanicola antarcticus]SNY46673.1 probable rRNA maturation factor [Pseudooceanicola antarcticus]